MEIPAENRKTLVVLGGGESGVGAALLAKARGYDVFLSDKGALKPAHRAALTAAGIAYEEGHHSEDRILAADEIIKSPGIPPTAPLLVAARELGIAITSEIGLGARYTTARLIAITGTNGKTTTTLLTHHLLTQAGIRAGLAGNVGYSLAGQVALEETAPVDYYVVELSSFQLEDTAEPLRPFAGALLNITPDHLDRYNYEFERYATAKLRLTNGMMTDQTLVFNLDDRGIRDHFPEAFFNGSKVPFSLRRPSLTHHPCAWWEPEELRAHFTLPGFDEPARSVSLAQSPLLGQHNLQNTLAAVVLAALAGATDAQLEAGLATFQNADHRLQDVGEVEGVRYLNDSKATNVEAAWFALDGIPVEADARIVWIAGGTDKGNDYASLLSLARQKVRALVCLGVDNVKLRAAFGETITEIVETRAMADAVAEARRLAYPGDVVLLSPCCASFDLFQNYEDRGRQFAAAVAALGGSAGRAGGGMMRFGRPISRFLLLLAGGLGGLLVPTPAPAQPADPLAALHQALTRATTDTARGRLYWALSEITDTSANIQLYAERAIPLLRGALPRATGAERLRLLRLLGAAVNNQGVGYLSQGMATRAQDCYVRAARLRQLGGDVRGQIESLYNLASVRFGKGDNARALHLYQQGVRAGEHVPAARGQVASCLQGMGSVYVQLGDTAAGLRCLEQVLTLAEQASEPALLAGRLIEVGEKYLEWRADTARAEACARQLQLLAARTPGTGGFLIRALLLRGEIRLRQHRWDEARALLRQANLLAVRQQEAEMKLSSETALARVEEMTGHPALALRYAQQAAADIHRSAALYPRQQTEELLSRLYEQAGQTGAALDHYRRFVSLRDSARNEANQRATYRQRLSYEYDQKETLLRARQEKRQAVASAEISRQKLLRNAVTGGAVLLSLLALVLWQRFRFQRRARRLIEQQKTQVESEKQRSDELLLNILPADVADELKATGKARARQHAGVTVLFADVVSFTQIAERLSPDQLVEALDAYFGTFDRLSEQFGLEKIKTIGDAYLLAGGLRGNLEVAPADVVRCALAMQAAVTALADARAMAGQPTFVWRIGIHTGPVVAGVVGLKKFAYDIWGDTVNTAARMEQSSEAGRINISEATYERVRAAFDCVARGQVAAKHKGEVAMYFVEGERAAGNLVG